MQTPLTQASVLESEPGFRGGSVMKEATVYFITCTTFSFNGFKYPDRRVKIFFKYSSPSKDAIQIQYVYGLQPEHQSQFDILTPRERLLNLTDVGHGYWTLESAEDVAGRIKIEAVVHGIEHAGMRSF